MLSKTGKNQLMTSPVLASRCPAFAPSIRQGKLDWSVTTPWGCARVNGELTQTHRNILDAIFASAIDTKDGTDGAIQILFDPFVIADMTGSSRDYKWLDSIFSDMKKADVHLHDKVLGLKMWGGIVSEWRESPRRVPMPGGALKGDRPLMAVTISAVWMKMYSSTLTVNYSKLIPAIASLPSGVLQSLTRFCLTHRELNMKLDEVLHHIGAIDESISRSQGFDIRKRAREADLSEFGITIEDDIVRYKQHDKVHFRNPKTNQIDQ